MVIKSYLKVVSILMTKNVTRMKTLDTRGIINENTDPEDSESGSDIIVDQFQEPIFEEDHSSSEKDRETVL